MMKKYYQVHNANDFGRVVAEFNTKEEAEEFLEREDYWAYWISEEEYYVRTQDPY